MDTDAQAPQRRFDLDWLRLLMIFGVFVFHGTRLFDTDDWIVKNGTTYLAVQVWLEFVNSWGMPMILIISGASAYLALDKYRPGVFARGLVLRLFVPLAVGTFTHVAFQVYLERLHKGTFHGSFLDFYPHYFEGMYAFGGNFAWMGLHLWYLELLFLVSLLCLPAFAWAKGTSLGRRLLQAAGNALVNPASVLLLALPTVFLILNLDEATWGTQSMGGWSVVIYPLFYLAGFVILSNGRLQEQLVGRRWVHLGAGMSLSAAHLFVEFQTAIPSLLAVAERLVYVLTCLAVWSWLLAILGFGMRHLNRDTPLRRYASEAALPFYILHQTVLLALAFFVVRWAIPDALKFGVVLSGTFVTVMALYECGVRRSNLLRFLFGMKPRARRAAEMRRFPAQQTA
jgi:peptidoglycan/LPS O-acetylase OafA/YrhL